MSKKLIFIIAPVLVLVLAAAGWMFMRPGGAPAEDPATAAGPVHTMSEHFVVNLADSAGTPRFVKVGVALRLSKASEDMWVAGTPSALAVLDGEPQVRDIVISSLQNRTSGALGAQKGRNDLKREIVARVNKETDLTILDVYYTDFAVQ